MGGLAAALSTTPGQKRFFLERDRAWKERL
jgi:hypothetical protein